MGWKVATRRDPNPKQLPEKKIEIRSVVVHLQSICHFGEEQSLQFAGLERDPEWKMKLGICDLDFFFAPVSILLIVLQQFRAYFAAKGIKVNVGTVNSIVA